MIDRLRAWLHRTTAPAVTPEPPARPKPIGMVVGSYASWEADRYGVPLVRPEDVWKRPEPMPGTLPAGIAMDSAWESNLPSIASMSLWALAGAQSEGLRFLGYPYLAELAQRTEYRMFAEKWAEHCTRKFIELHVPGSEDPEGEPAKRLKELQDFLGEGDGGIKLKSTIYTAITQDFYFGRSQVFLDFDDADRPDELAKPLVMNPGKIKPERPLKRIRAVEPMWSYPGMYEATNPLSEKFYKPDKWYVQGKIVDASRLLTIIGRPVPDMLKPAYAFGGLSMTQMSKPYVDNWLTTRQSATDLVVAFSQIILATDMSSLASDGGALVSRMFEFAATRRNNGVIMVDKDNEEVSNVTTPLSGVDKLQAQSQEHMSSVSSIPLVVLTGITPSGLNASSDSEIAVFYAAINGYQERAVRSVVQGVLDVAQLSLWGAIDPDITFSFPNLQDMDELQQAEIAGKKADTHGKYIDKGVIGNDEVRDHVTSDPKSPYHGLKGPAPEPDDDDEPTGRS
jgi:phage-related protein (TIGR01555 family)